MDALALESAIKALEIRSDSLADWLEFWVVLVVIGVVLEVVFVIWEYRESLEEYHRNVPTTLRKPSGWKLLFELLGAGLVAIGVAGELGVDFKAGDVQTALRARNGELIQLLRTASELATKEAGDAKVQASNNEKEAAQLRKEAAILRKQAASLMLDVASANAMAAEARSMAATSDLARAELEARIAPRTLSLSQREFVGRTLRRFAFGFVGRKVVIHWQPIDLEAAVFGVEIRDALRRANIPVETDASLILGDSAYGVKITGTGNDLTFIQALDGLLRTDTSSAVSWEVSPKYPISLVRIEVSAKPPLGLDTLGQILPDESSQSAPPPKPDRHLTREQQNVTARQLRPFIGQRAIFVLFPGDREVLGIASDIDAALNAARWIRSPGRPLNMGRLRGILIEVNGSATDRDRSAAEWLGMALRDNQLDVIGPIRSNRANLAAPIIITIGRNQ